jgi:hypothetical protein
MSELDLSQLADASGDAATIAPLRLFITQGTWRGDFGVGGAIAKADSFCQADSARPNSGTYKAVLVDGATRTACTTVACTGGLAEHADWALRPERTYLDDAGFLLVTNQNGIFDFPLAHPITNFGVYWTGLKGDWTTASDTCGGWLSMAGATLGVVGRGDLTTSEAIAYSTGIFCNNSRALLCSEQ